VAKPLHRRPIFSYYLTRIGYRTPEMQWYPFNPPMATPKLSSGPQFLPPAISETNLARSRCYQVQRYRIKMWTLRGTPGGRHSIFAARCYASAAYAVMRCVSATFIHSVKTNKRIFKIFSPSGSYTILVFPYQTAWQYSDGNTPPPQRGRRMQGG